MMKNYLNFNLKGLMTFLFLSIISLSLSAQGTTTVKLRVDMTGQGVSAAYVTGTFTDNNGWSILPMTQEGETDVYFIELELTPGILETYYFLSANDWVTREAVPQACWNGAWDNHRGFTVPDAPVTYGYMFGGCDPVGSATPPLTSITLRVDMTGQDVTNGVFATGTFTAPAGGDWIFKPMAQEGETNIYSVTVSLPVGSYTYVFWRHNNWDNDYRETVPEACALSGTIVTWNTDRLLVVTEDDETIGVIYGTCDAIGAPTGMGSLENAVATFSPNPARDVVFVNITKIAGNATVSLYNLSGQQVLSTTSANRNQVSLDVSEFPRGLYILNVTTGNQSSSQKLIIE